MQGPLYVPFMVYIVLLLKTSSQTNNKTSSLMFDIEIEPLSIVGVQYNLLISVSMGVSPGCHAHLLKRHVSKTALFA